MQQQYDLAIVGAGIIGLACAYRASLAGKKVVVIERDAQAVGASVRNFGFVTVSGQRAGAHWQRARKTRDIWAQVAPQAGIDVCHQGLHLSAQREEAHAVLEEFAQSDMGSECVFLSQAQIQQQAPYLKNPRAVLYSPHELRVESKTAVPILANWLASQHKVTFLYQTTAQVVDLPNIVTNRGTIAAKGVIVCPGADLSSLYPQEFAKAQAQLCSLNMLRVAPKTAFKLNAALMSDLSLGRYEGFTGMKAAAALEARLNQELPQARQAGVHVIVVQSADGSLVIGDSHVYGNAEQPFRDEHFDEYILDELARMLDIGTPMVVERWSGVYPSAQEVSFIGKPEDNVVLGSITGGTGASTCFAFADELLAQLCL